MSDFWIKTLKLDLCSVSDSAVCSWWQVSRSFCLVVVLQVAFYMFSTYMYMHGFGWRSLVLALLKEPQKCFFVGLYAWYMVYVNWLYVTFSWIFYVLNFINSKNMAILKVHQVLKAWNRPPLIWKRLVLPARWWSIEYKNVACSFRMFERLCLPYPDCLRELAWPQ